MDRRGDTITDQISRQSPGEDGGHRVVEHQRGRETQPGGRGQALATSLFITLNHS
jgi:hypothetical protein